MRKKRILFSLSGIALLAVLLILFPIILARNENYSKGEWSRTLLLQDGIVRTEYQPEIPPAEDEDPHLTMISQFEIYEDGNYDLILSNLLHGQSSGKALEDQERPGFITLCVFLDQAGNPIFSECGANFTVSKKLFFEKGIYEIDFYLISDEETYLEYAKEFLCGSAFVKRNAAIIDFDSLPKSGTWTMDYSLEITKEASPAAIIPILLLTACITVGLILFITAIVTENEDSIKGQYDERQELEKGRGFRLAAITMTVFYFLLSLSGVFGVVLPIEASVLYSIGVILGLTIYCVYCIWHESYFALNQKKDMLMVSNALIALSNLILGLSSLARGDMLQNGILTFRSLNLFCAIMFLVLFTTILLKKIVASRKKAEDDEEDE